MGCDIHMLIEHKKDDKWVLSCPENLLNFDKKLNEYEEMSNPRYDYFSENYRISRDYFLFSVLAGVRNYSDIIPISKPKGKPIDVSPYTADCFWENDGHSYSYLTLGEIMNYDWMQSCEQSGYLNGYDYYWYSIRNKNKEKPDRITPDRDKVMNNYIFEGMSHSKYKSISKEEMDDRIKDIVKRSKKDVEFNIHKVLEQELGQIYCKVYWDEKYCEFVPSFFSEFIPKLWNISRTNKLKNPCDELRLVFFFDN